MHLPGSGNSQKGSTLNGTCNSGERGQLRFSCFRELDRPSRAVPSTPGGQAGRYPRAGVEVACVARAA